MHQLIHAFPLYHFLKCCNASPLEKVILDCGAGGANPPLSLFYEFGYKTYGIEISETQLKQTEEFCRQNRMDLNIVKGDMTQLPFPREFCSFLFSYNTSVHMKKADFRRALQEFHRVLKPQGLCYVNFLSTQCDSFGKGQQVDRGEFRQVEGQEKVYYSHYEQEELSTWLTGFQVMYHENRTITRIHEGETHTSGFLEYILKKAG